MHQTTSSILTFAMSVSQLCFAQTTSQTTDAAQPTMAPAPAEIELDIAPLRPFEPTLVFASHRDESLFYLYSAASVSEKQFDTAIRYLLQAALIDHRNLTALFDLAILIQRRGDWDGSQGFLEEIAKSGDGEVQALARKELERVRVIANLEHTEAGRRRRKYDMELLAALDAENGGNLQTALDAYATVIKNDNRRWEAPARVGALLADRERFAESARYFSAALAVAESSNIRAALQHAASDAQREADFLTSRGTAEAAWDAGDYRKAAQSFEQGWRLFPERSDAGFSASTSNLMYDDVSGAVRLLLALRDSGDEPTTNRATAMLRELSVLDPQARAEVGKPAHAPSRPKSGAPSRISALIPDPVTSDMRVAARPPSDLFWKTQPPMIAQALAEDQEIAEKAALPPVEALVSPFPQATGENPLTEYRQSSTEPSPAPTAVESVKLIGSAAAGGKLRVDSTPIGAEVRIDPGQQAADPTPATCKTPCEIVAPVGAHTLSVSKAGFQRKDLKVVFKRLSQVKSFDLTPSHGKILIVTPNPGATVFVNGEAINAVTPCRLILPVGSYEIAVESGTSRIEREIMVREAFAMKVTLE
jgi:tetratricopeptide (TPR) repeat protein